MKNLRFSYLLLMIFIIASCAKDQWFDPPDHRYGDSSPHNIICQQIKIAVVSDIHYMHPTLLCKDILNHPDFQAVVSADRKLFELSDPIFRKVISELVAEKPDILLITGDLAREGEEVNHQTVKSLLRWLEKKGTKIFIVPGNNDINNPDAKTFSTIPASTVPNITPEEFVSIYGDFGYNDALYKDANSLSYINQPFKKLKLWILGIDAIKAFNPGTMAWIQEKMAEASKKKITVLAMMHYGIIEHYTGQKNIEPLIKSSKDNAIALMEAGIRLIFTGHYHANDIVEFTNDGKTLYDIQTGSLVTPPYSYRIMTLDDNFIKIDSRRVTNVRSRITGDMSFLKYSDVTLTSRINSFFTFYSSYVQKVYGIPPEQYEQYQTVVPYLTKAYKAYFAGDERIDTEEKENIDVLGQSLPAYLPLLDAFWTDLPPQDNKINIELK